MSHTIAFFISPHGFGHAARAAGVMQACQEIIDDVHFFLFTSVPGWFFEQSQLTNFTMIQFPSDVGVLQSTPFTEDFEATLTALDRFYPVTEPLLAALSQKLLENKIELVICDIAPIGILAAQKAGLPSLLIENFTWDWIYQAYETEYPQFKPYISLLNSYFAKADYRIQTEPLCDSQTDAIYLPQPIARRQTQAPSNIRQRLGIAADETIVLLSMGGIKENFLSTQLLAIYDQITFLIPGANDEFARVNNCVFLPHHSEFYHPDLIAAANYMIGKAGYSTIAEVLQVGIPFGFISRDRFREAPILANFIKKHLPNIELTESEYRDNTWKERIPELLALSKSASPILENGAIFVAKEISKILAGHSS